MAPVNLHRIGGFHFVTMTGETPTVRQEALEILEFPGVSQQRYRKVGRRSQPFRVRTAVDVSSMGSGRALAVGYSGLVGAGPQDFVWNDLNITTGELMRVKVLEVQPEGPRAAARLCGWIDDSNFVILRALWTLQFVELVVP